ncbi:MAG: hypothetical protein KAX49_16015 [Halanaerobiales bacterium]|nr:hypothetical protein [Halanaerobiales bacterium]
MGKDVKDEKLVSLEVKVSQELGRSIDKMAKLKGLSGESLIRLWIEDGLERDELRFERLLLFADMSEDLNEETIRILNNLKTKYFDSANDGKRGLDPYLVKSLNLNHLYHASCQERSKVMQEKEGERLAD